MGSKDDLFQRALLALSDSDFSRAKKLTEEILEQDEKNVEGWSLLSSIYRQTGELKEALEAAKRATDLDPKTIQHWNNLGYLYLIQSNWKAGEKCYAKAASLPNPPPTIFLNYAWALIEQGQEAKALKELKQAIEQSLEDTVSEMIQTEEKYSKLRPLLKKIK